MAENKASNGKKSSPVNGSEKKISDVVTGFKNIIKRQSEQENLIAEASKNQTILTKHAGDIQKILPKLEIQQTRVENQIKFIAKRTENTVKNISKVSEVQQNMIEDMKKLSTIQKVISDEFSSIQQDLSDGKQSTTNNLTSCNLELQLMKKNYEQLSDSMTELKTNVKKEIKLVKDELYSLKQSIVNDLVLKLYTAFDVSPEKDDHDDKVEEGKIS